MNQQIVIKANNFGIMVMLNEEQSFEDLKQSVADKFSESRKFLGEASMALGFDGRKLNDEEEKELIDVITANSDLQIVCIIDTDPTKEATFKKALDEKLFSLDAKNAQFYKGNLRSGQVAEFETGVIVLGDINPGAKIVSKGNIVVIGSLKGTAFAGASGNSHAFVIALDMNPGQLRIADIMGRASDAPDEETGGIKIAYIEDDNIYIESIDKNVLNSIIIE